MLEKRVHPLPVSQLSTCGLLLAHVSDTWWRLQSQISVSGEMMMALRMTMMMMSVIWLISRLSCMECDRKTARTAALSSLGCVSWPANQPGSGRRTSHGSWCPPVLSQIGQLSTILIWRYSQTCLTCAQTRTKLLMRQMLGRWIHTKYYQSKESWNH